MTLDTVTKYDEKEWVATGTVTANTLLRDLGITRVISRPSGEQVVIFRQVAGTDGAVFWIRAWAAEGEEPAAAVARTPG
jgi:hypothetical protein